MYVYAALCTMNPDVPGQISKLVPRLKCYSKSREVCNQVPNEVYISVPRQSCAQVTKGTKNGIYEDAGNKEECRKIWNR